MTMNGMNRREFVGTAALAAAAAAGGAFGEAAGDELDTWQRETDMVGADVYERYMLDGDTRGLKSLERLEGAFEKVLREVREARPGDVPAVWSVYNMGYVVKTRGALFSIDLVHRRAAELAPMLDFALITHNHSDHWRTPFYRAMDGAGKMVVSNFLDNYGATGHRGGKRRQGGYIRGVKTFRLGDVEVRTSLIDHNDYLVDFTTAFEMRIGDFVLYHTGDSGKGTEPKLGTVWGRPDLWLFFPGCGIDVATAVRAVKPKRVVFGHLWELGHRLGRLTTPMIRPRLVQAAEAGCGDVSVAYWGDRVTA